MTELNKIRIFHNIWKREEHRLHRLCQQAEQFLVNHCTAIVKAQIHRPSTHVRKTNRRRRPNHTMTEGIIKGNQPIMSSKKLKESL